MKNKSTNTEALKPILDTGVNFEYRGSKTTGSKAISVIFGTLLNYILSMAIALGGIFTFTSTFKIEYHKVFLFVVALVFGLLLNIIYQLPKKFVRYSVLGILAAIVATAAIGWGLTVSGFEYVRDFVLVSIAKYMLWSVPELSYTFSEAMKVDTTFVLLLLSLLVITGVSYFTVRKINFFFVFLITFPLFEIGAAFGMVPNHFCFASMLAGWMGVFAMHSSTIVRKIKKRRKDKKKSKTTVAEKKQTLIATIGIIVAIITFVTFSLGHFLVGLAGYSRPEDMKALRGDLKNYVTDLIDYIFGLDNDGSMREGRLYQLGDRIIKDRRYLTVTAPMGEQNYLRGYIGGEYTGDSWMPNQIDPNYDWLEDSFESSGYYPQNMQGKALESIAERNTFVEKAAATITISNLRRKKDYAFTAYVPSIPSSFDLSGDSFVEPDSKSSYSYNSYVDTSNLFMVKQSPLFDNKEFSSIWKEYSKYVKYNYTKLPNSIPEVETIVEGLENGTGYGYKGKGVAQSNIAIADRIREYLNANIEYSLLTPTMPTDRDFVEWLLLDNKKGYAAHYATAMTVMLRMAKVPARYVEGYVITPDDFQNAKPTDDEGYYSMDLTDLNAHAWVEIYENNYGWIPIEATPGFFEGSLLDEFDMNEDNFDSSDAAIEEELEPGEEESLQDDPNEEIMLPEYPEEDPEVKLEEEDSSGSFLQTIFAIIKYFFIFVGLTIAIFIVLLLLVFVVLLIKRAIKLSILKKNITSSDYKRKIESIYKYYMRLLTFENIVNTDSLPYLEFARKASSESTVIAPEKHLKAMNIFLKYRFSEYGLSEDEIKYLESLIAEYRKESPKGLSLEDKIQFKLIDNLG